MYAIPYIEFQGAQWFWNSLNFLNCSGFFLVLEMYLKKPTFSGLFWNCSWIQNFYNHFFCVTTFPVVPCLDLPFVIKYYFNCVQGSLNNRFSHQLTVIFLLYLICACFHNQIDWYDIFSLTAGLQIIFNYQDDIQLFAKVFGKLHILVFWDLEGIQLYMVWVPSLKLGGRWWISSCYNSRGLVFSDMLGEGSDYISCGRGGGLFCA